jgi:hypothetical protein
MPGSCFLLLTASCEGFVMGLNPQNPTFARVKYLKVDYTLKCDITPYGYGVFSLGICLTNAIINM